MFMKQKNAFTLVELLLYIGLVVIILLAVVQLLAVMLQSRIKHQVITQVEEQGMLLMQRITQSIRNTDAIFSPATGEASNALSLDVAGVNNDPTVFSSSGGIIQMTEGANSSVALIAGKVILTDLRFHNLSRAGTPGMIRIDFTLRYDNTTGRQEYEYSKHFFASASLR